MHNFTSRLTNKEKLIILATASSLYLSTSAFSFEVIDKKLEIYGKIKVSVDYSDPDISSGEGSDDKNLSFASNSSRIGFKGTLEAAENLSFIYQIEQTINLDEGSGDWANRDSFGGIAGSWGKLKVGYLSTPFKNARKAYDLFEDTVADQRGIIGAGATSGNSMNKRAKNALMYENKFRDVSLQALYSTDGNDDNSGGLDNNDKDMYSVGAFYKKNGLYLAGAYESWEELNSGKDLFETSGWRVSASYKWKTLRFGAIYEDISSENEAGNDTDLARAAWGLNGLWEFRPGTDVRLQWLQADENELIDDSDAMKISLGVYNQLNKTTSIYAIYTTTNNEDNAKYQGVDGGSGDEVKTELGGSPSAFSVGFAYKF